MEQEQASSARRPRVLLCGSGSVAAVKLPALALALAEFADVRLVLTRAAGFFLQQAAAYDARTSAAFESRSADFGAEAATTEDGGGGVIEILRDEHEWDNWRVVGDRVLHIELKDWADVLVAAPLSANSLAKIANGLSDNLLTSVARAWSGKKPFVYAPAMNTDMWEHPVTATHVTALGAFGYELVPPVAKMLACGVVGVGGLAAVDDIVRVVKARTQSIGGERVDSAT